jgi:hypothetical protein
VRFIEHVKRGACLRQFERFEHLAGGWAVGGQVFVVDRIAVTVEDGCGDRSAASHDAAAARIDEHPERGEVVAVGHDAGVDNEQDLAVP